MSHKVALLIPLFNEAAFIDQLLPQLLTVAKKLPTISSIILINDGSTDQTAKKLTKYTSQKLITILTHPKNQGKGAALRTGFQKAKTMKVDAVIAMDGDCQHDPKLLKQFLTNLQKYPVVFGYREFSGSMSFARRAGNALIAWTYQYLFKINRKDPLCGFLGWRKDVFELITWRSNDYGVEPEIAAVVSKYGLSYTEVQIPTIYLDKKNGLQFSDAMKIFSKLPYWYWVHLKSTSAPSNRAWRVLMGAIILVWFMCSFKYPFQPTSLIGNLEPFPDTIFYLNPPWSWLHGHGWQMTADEGIYATKQIVPPAYSLVNLPLLWLTSDVRSFYLTNIVLGLLTLSSWVMIAKNLWGDRWSTWVVVGITGFLIATHFYLYTLPHLAMAENLTLALVSLELWLLLQLTDTFQKRVAIVAALLPAALFLTKFSNTATAAVFGLWYLWIVGKQKIDLRQKILFLTPLAAGTLLSLIYILSSQVLVGHKNLKQDQGFALQYFLPNFVFYLKSVLGGKTHLLWFSEYLFTRLFAMLALIGLSFGLFTKSVRQKWVWLTFLLSTNLLFISFFITPDTRHIITFIPVLFLAVGQTCIFVFRFISRKMSSPKKYVVMGGFTVLILFIYLLLPGFGYRSSERTLVTLKKQISLNFRYQETPWHYIAVQNWVGATNQIAENSNKKIYVATVLPAYYVELASNSSSNFSVLPLTPTQEFFDEPSIQQDVLKNKTLLARYEEILNQGDLLFISPYYVNNLRVWGEQYDQLLTQVEVKKISNGCFDSCALYQITAIKKQ